MWPDNVAYNFQGKSITFFEWNSFVTYVMLNANSGTSGDLLRKLMFRLLSSHGCVLEFTHLGDRTAK